MKASEIGLCFHPTLTMLVDDNKDYLKHIGAFLANSHNLPCYLYDNPKLALDFLNTHYQADPFTNHCFSGSDEFNSQINHVVTNLNVWMIHQEIYNPNRFRLISNVIADYGMPGLSGAKFLRLINDVYVVKSMLTGEGDHNLAVQLFNSGEISKFFLKNNNELLTVLVDGIHQLQQKFFMNLSELMINKLTKKTNQSLLCLEDVAFINLFINCFNACNAVEYYLLNEQGSFLFLDKDANPSWLIVANEDGMEGYYNIAKFYDDTPESVTKALKERTMIPYFHMESVEVPPTHWLSYMYPTESIEGNKKYYYAFLTNTSAYTIYPEKITSYQTFLDNFYQQQDMA